MHVTSFVQLRSDKVSNVPNLRDMQHELHSLIDERNLVRRLNDGLFFHVLQLTVDASIQRRVAHVTINPLNAELNPICHLLTLLAHHILHVNRVRVNLRFVGSLLKSNAVLLKARSG